MQANEQVAKKLSELSLKARLERAEIQQEIIELRNSPKSIANVGLSAIKTARAIGFDEIKFLLPIAKPIAKTFLLPAGLAIGRVLMEKSSPKRVAGAAAILIGALGIFKGIQYDNKKHLEDRYLPVVEENPTQPDKN